MSKRKEVLSQAGSYATATILTQLVTMLAGFLSRRFLGPIQTGMWGILQVVLSYAGLSALGVTSAATREIPFYVGKGMPGKANEIRDIVFSFSILSSVLVAAAIAIYAFWNRDGLGPVLYYGLLFVCSLIILQRFNDLLVTFLRAYKEFEIAGRQIFYSAIFNAFAVALLTYRAKIYGFMWAMCLSFVFNIAYVFVRYRFHIHFRFNWKITKDLIAYGFPLMILGFLAVVFFSIDRIMIAKFFGFEQLGFYGIAILAVNSLAKIPSSIGTVLLPNFHEKYGERESKEDLAEYLSKSCTAFSYVMPCIIGPAWICAPLLIRFALPQFSESIIPFKILVLSLYFLALSNPCENFIIAIKKQWWLFPVVGASCVMAVGLNWAAIRFGFGISGIAFATTATFAIKFIADYFLVYFTISTRKRFLQDCLILLTQFIIMLATLALTRVVFGRTDTLYNVFLGTILFLLLQVPFLLRFNKKFGFVKFLREKIREKKKSKSSLAGQEELIENASEF